MVELGVFVGNFSIQAVGEVVQDADAVLHRLHHPQKKNANITLGRKLWSSTREDMDWAIISFFSTTDAPEPGSGSKGWEGRSRIGVKEGSQ